ncbi:MAG: histidine--tRNA ligase [Chloroflexi bacterium]|nr:histidine--tRNA ligase [Chloroflexota bacterium]
MSKQKLYRPRPISGFPEWLPEQKAVELKWIDIIRQHFERYGFCSIETPSVEVLDVLLAKGETEKEMYAIHRFQADDGTDDARLALHTDLTVPFARYVAQHFNELTFPFKRYQIQRCWRGERPQAGRYREFCQCDIDVVDVERVSLRFDAEIPAIVYDVLNELEIGDFQIGISNRKILYGYCQGLGIDDAASVVRVVDKYDKIGREGVLAVLQSQLGLGKKLARQCVEIAQVRTPDMAFVDAVRALGVQSDLLDEGLDELVFVMDALSDLPRGIFFADLSIARGWDYYTGTIYEGRLSEFPSIGTIVSGGRYDDLASSFIKKKLPGVGISIGLTRIFGALLAENRLELGPKCPTQVLVILPNEEQRGTAAGIANLLRQRGLNTETYHEPVKISRQLRYASKKGIPYVWFPPFDENGAHEIKDMVSRTQVSVDPETWTPDCAT